MEVSVRPITVSEELAAVGRTRARRCRAALIERDADGDDSRRPRPTIRAVRKDTSIIRLPL